MKIIQRPTLERLLLFEQKSWPTELQADKEALAKRLADFGRGVFMLNDGEDVTQVTVAPKIIPAHITGFEQMRDLPVNEISRDLWVVNIATHRDHRGKGYAKKLIDHVIDWATEEGFHTIQTGVTLHGLKGSRKSPIDYMTANMNPAFKLFPVDDYKLVKDYWLDDEDSKGWGCVLKVDLQAV